MNAGGGVPKFNRDLHAAFPDRECVHFCAADLPSNEHRRWEWEQARALNLHLIATKQLRRDDVIVADGFWAAGLENFPYAISHSHGIWGHITHDDVKLGKEPENPFHHVAQVSFRRNWTRLERPLTAVSKFIADQMYLQWGFRTDRVIENGVDTEYWCPRSKLDVLKRPLIVHGVNDRANTNKGWDHIKLLADELPDVIIMSLDEMYQRLGLGHVDIMPVLDRFQKNWALAQADLVVHPSGYEGCSMFIAEALSCGIPVVGYDVGYMYSVKDSLSETVMDRRNRSPEFTLENVKRVLADADLMSRAGRVSRVLAINELDIKIFRNRWRAFIHELENS